MLYFLTHEPSRGIGGKTASPTRGTAYRVNLPGGASLSNISKDGRKYAAEPRGVERRIRKMTQMLSRVANQHAVSEEEALQLAMAGASKTFVEKEVAVFGTH